jgi:hypothetical protein
MQTKRQRRPGVTRPIGNQRSLWGKTLVEMGQGQINTVGKPLEGQVFPEHQRSRSNPIHGHKGGINHLESSLTQQELDT